MDPRFKPYSNMNAALALTGPDDNFSDMLTWVPQSMRATQVHPMLIPSPAPVFQDNSLPPVGTTVRPVDVLAWNGSAHCPDPVPGLTVPGLSEVMPPPDHDLSMHPNALGGQADDHRGWQSTTAMPNTFDLLPDQHLQPIPKPFSCSSLGQSECLDDQPRGGRVQFMIVEDFQAVVSGPPAQSMDIAGSVQPTLHAASLVSASGSETSHMSSQNDAVAARVPVGSAMQFSCPEPGSSKSFDFHYQLNYHTQFPHTPGHSHVNLPGYKASCECGAKFTRMSSFNRHVNQKRKAVKTHPCPREDCPYIGQRKEHVKQHLEHGHKLSPDELESIIPRVNPRVINNCDVDDCDAGPFPSQSDFTKHKREAHDLTPYPCVADGCNRNGNKGFVSHEAYRKHVEKHHSSLNAIPPRPKKTEMCGACRKTMQSSSLKYHLGWDNCKAPKAEQYAFAIKRFPPTDAIRRSREAAMLFTSVPWWYNWSEPTGNGH